MAAAPQQKNILPAAGSEEELQTVVYRRCVIRELRVLDANIAKLDLQLNEELEKISSCSVLLDEIISKPNNSSPCSALREELDRVRTKRERAHQKFLEKYHQQEI
ncbi:hypothetical protein BS78_06G292600 [Paspalum vaginatum]|nr:hypothetical protein BS78_06G292600 [Paspalum vaginatum]